jgi:hypothetical protein
LDKDLRARSAERFVLSGNYYGIANHGLTLMVIRKYG